MVAGCPSEEAGDTDGEDTEAATGGTSSGPTSSSTATGTGGPACMPGEIQECTCTDGSMSDQICLADGSGFSACDCVGGTTEPQTGSGEDSGSGDSGSGEDSGSGSGSSTGPMPECDGAHPLVEGDLRYCEKGNCYCGDFSVEPPFDVCFTMDIAEACCPVEVMCY